MAGRLRPFADVLYFHLMGEPTAHPLLPRFLSIAHDMGFMPILTTNGTLLPKRGGQLLADGVRPAKVSISLHAFEANPMEGLSFADYLSGCIDFAQALADAGSITVFRLWNLDGRAEGALHTRNREILAALEAAFPLPWQDSRRGGQLLSDRIFLEWGDKFDWPTTEGPPLTEEGFCYGLRDQIGVLADGTVVPCCLDHRGDAALGNLFDTPLDQILSSPEAKTIYDGFTAHRCVHPLCKRCMRSMYYRQPRKTT